jgi:cytochrome c553
MRSLITAVRGVVLATTLITPAAALAQQGNAAAGEAKAATCVACHGAGGISTMPGVPSLAGQPPQFLQLQMILFREGLRESDQMAPFMKPLKDADLNDLAAYFAKAAPPTAAGGRDEKLATQGAQLSAKGNCASCHAAGYVGQAQIPRLTSQREDYLFATMQAYRDNKRTGTDTSMNGVVAGMADADLKALAHYFATR